MTVCGLKNRLKEFESDIYIDLKGIWLKPLKIEEVIKESNKVVINLKRGETIIEKDFIDKKGLSAKDLIITLYQYPDIWEVNIIIDNINFEEIVIIDKIEKNEFEITINNSLEDKFKYFSKKPITVKELIKKLKIFDENSIISCEENKFVVDVYKDFEGNAAIELDMED